MTDYTVHNLVQGSPEWESFRFKYHGASEAAAMLGLSPNMKRTELLHLKKTAMPKEFSDFVQERILDRGHELEALARPLIEEDLGEDLYPVTCSLGSESASLDGLTMSGDIAFEHKQWNEGLALAVENGNVPDSHMPQCQQILMVTGAERVRFTVSDGTRDRLVWTDVAPDTSWFKRIRAGWAQFDKDLAEYEPREAELKPAGRTPETLPALLLEVTGRVTASNLTEFRDHALAVFAGINRELTTDQEFADAEKTVKWCGDVESRLAAAKQHALAQTASIEELFRTIDDISAEARRVRLDLNKLVEKRKVEVKESIVWGARTAYDKHIAALKSETGGAWVELQKPDFAGAAKGKRSIASIQDAVDTALANGKIEADASAKRIRANIALLERDTEGYEFLFNDWMGLATKQLEDLELVISSRISKHKADEQRKEEEARERIRREEAARADREAKAAAEKVLAEEQAMRQLGEYPSFSEAVAASNAGLPLEFRRTPHDAWQPCDARHQMDGHFYYRRSPEVATPAPAPSSEPAAALREITPPPTAAPVSRLAPRKRAPARPTDAEIVRVLVDHFGATEADVIGWLCDLDFSTPGHAA